MPVEIKELVIRAVVERPGERSAGASGGATSAGSSAPALGVDEREALVEAAVKEVLRILRASKER